MKKHIISLPHHPKRVIIISLLIALAVGAYGYIRINRSVLVPANVENKSINPNTNISALRNLSLGFLTSGRVKSVSVVAGQAVKADQVLAELDAENTLGALTQARAAYSTAEANYRKIINGATGSIIDVARTAVNSAKINLEHITNQQETMVVNTRRKLNSDGLIAEPDSTNQTSINPVITGDYNGANVGDYFISFKDINFIELSFTGLEKGTTVFSTLPKPLGVSGLLISFPGGSDGYYFSDSWTVHIPNKSGVNYINNLNAYQLALQNKDQAIAGAQATLDQANATLTSVITSARSEDVAVAQAQMNNALGAVQIAESAYKSAIIIAPTDGIVASINIVPGQIALPNAPVIEFISNNSAN